MAAISIIVPVFNTEKYISRCIDSILAQTYADYELIIVDDGSFDRSGEKCDQYARKDSRIRVIHQSNGGLSDARNRGLDAATGSYVLFVDSDDYILPQMLQTMLSKSIEYDADVVICGFLHIQKDDKPVEETCQIPSQECEIDKTEALAAMNRYLEYGCVTNKMFRRRLFDTIRFPKGKIFEDHFVLPGLYGSSSKIVIIPDRLYCYVHTNGSITRSDMNVRSLDLIESHYERIKMLEREGLTLLLPESAKDILDLYLRFRKRITIRSSGEKKRLHEIRKMVRYSYLRYGKRIRKAEILSFEMPGLFQLLQRIKRAFVHSVQV